MDVVTAAAKRVEDEKRAAVQRIRREAGPELEDFAERLAAPLEAVGGELGRAVDGAASYLSGTREA